MTGSLSLLVNNIEGPLSDLRELELPVRVRKVRGTSRTKLRPADRRVFVG
jgi:hypothetical protein